MQASSFPEPGLGSIPWRSLIRAFGEEGGFEKRRQKKLLLGSVLFASFVFPRGEILTEVSGQTESSKYFCGIEIIGLGLL